jgi:hypothetical protein
MGERGNGKTFWLTGWCGAASGKRLLSLLFSVCCCMTSKIGTRATFSGNTGACGLTKTDRLPSRRSLVSVTGGFCELLFFRLLGFFPALFGALPNAMSNTLYLCPPLDLPFFWIGTTPITHLMIHGLALLPGHVSISSSVTEEHGALRHILCRGPFSATFGPLLKNFFRRHPRSPKKFSVSVPFWESKNFSGHTPIFPKDEKFFTETPTMFIATVDVYLL